MTEPQSIASRQLAEAIDQATGTTAEQRRKAIDERCEKYSHLKTTKLDGRELESGQDCPSSLSGPWTSTVWHSAQCQPRLSFLIDKMVDVARPVGAGAGCKIPSSNGRRLGG